MVSGPALVPGVLGELALGIDHVAIAVADLEASLKLYIEVLGFSLRSRTTTRGASTGMISAVVEAPGVTLVLLQGTEPESQVSRFVAEHGPGVQHIAISVSDLDAARHRLEANGYQLITPTIASGCTRQVFGARDDVLGVGLELLERTEPGFADRAVEELFRHLERQGLY
jgi:methylmalonyl-CoA epimerase